VYVLSLLEYNSVVWPPQGKQDTECIEQVLRRFTKHFSGLKSYPYKVRLKQLNSTTFELRHLHINLVWCYKTVLGPVDVSFNDFFTSAPFSQTRGHRHKLFKWRCSTNVDTSFFVNRVTDVWNYLPENITDFNSLSAFKHIIKMIDFATFLKCVWYFFDCTLLCNIWLFYMCTCHSSFIRFYRCIHIFLCLYVVMHCTFNSALILWYHVSGGVITLSMLVPSSMSKLQWLQYTLST